MDYFGQVQHRLQADRLFSQLLIRSGLMPERVTQSSSSRHPQRGLKLAIHAVIGKRHVPFLRRKLIAAHAVLRPALRELSIALVGDGPMSRLHRKFMNVEGPTDVLTFPLELDGRHRAVSGEVIVCVPEARRQAKLRGTKAEEEVLLYALHGMLHLCGFDDRTQSAFRKMHRMEDEILTRLGIGPVFALPTAKSNSHRPRRSFGA